MLRLIVNVAVDAIPSSNSCVQCHNFVLHHHKCNPGVKNERMLSATSHNRVLLLVFIGCLPSHVHQYLVYFYSCTVGGMPIGGLCCCPAVFPVKCGRLGKAAAKWITRGRIFSHWRVYQNLLEIELQLTFSLEGH